MFEFPTSHTVGHRVWSGSGDNGWGDQNEQWSDPIQKPVIGWGAPVSTSPVVVGEDRAVIEVQLLIPPGFECGPNDRMVLNGQEYEVVGDPATSEGNPWEWNPGGVVNLRRVTVR